MKIFKVEGVDTCLGPSADSLNEKAPSIVFLHGAGCDHTYWAPYADYFFDKGFNVLAPDFPAHGQSQGEALESVEESAIWLRKVEAQMGLSFDFIVGHSQGFLVGLEYAARYGTKELGLIGVATSLAIPVNQDLIDMAKHSPKEAATLMMKWSLSEATQQKLQQGSLGWSSDESIQLMAQNPLANDLQACANYTNGEDAAKRAESLKIKSLMVLSKEDKMTPVSQGELTASSLGAEMILIEDAGHMLPLEAFQSVLNGIAKFVGVSSA